MYHNTLVCLSSTLAMQPRASGLCDPSAPQTLRAIATTPRFASRLLLMSALRLYGQSCVSLPPHPLFADPRTMPTRPSAVLLLSTFSAFLADD